MKTHTYTCIKCPLSCEIELIEEENTILEVKGHTCSQGEKYVTEEFTNPVRVLTTTVRIEKGVLPVLPVRSEEPIPKDMMKRCVKELSTLTVKAPIHCGDTICENILNTGIKIIASRDIKDV
jgi:CxxC motif-containing protein